MTLERFAGTGAVALLTLLGAPAFAQPPAQSFVPPAGDIPAAKPAPPDADAGLAADQVVQRGYRRVFVTQRQAISPEEVQARIRAGKPLERDPQTGEQIVQAIVDHLPTDWLRERPPGPAPDLRVDSQGNPIVNETPGLPAWAQRDVEALRAATAEWRDRLAQQRAAGMDVRETEGILGNFVGQAITRSIGIDDLLNIDDAAVVTPGVAASILGYLHFYENIRYMNQPLFRYEYTRTAYPARIAAFAQAHGADLDAVQALELDGLRGGVPSGCYARTTFTRGMTNLSGQTDIWVANGFDDASADVPTGFPLFFFYDCEDPDNNDQVRVSTNGYISFFQQGGGATNGINFQNEPIVFPLSPDGYAAPWWDDLVVALAQGNTDRVSYKTEGAVDSRVFTVEWFSMTRLGGDTTDYHFFQVKLYETIDVVELQYGVDNSGWSPDSIDSATAGIELYTGAGGDCGPNCLNTNATPPPNDYRFTPTPRPDNDNCGNAVELINGAVVTGNLHRATPDGNANCGASSNNRDVWYTFLARCNGTLHASTCGSRDINGSETGIDTVLSVHSGCPGTTANQLACNDDAGLPGCSGNDSDVSVAMTAGQRVFIRVTHFGDAAFRFASGAFQLSLNFVSSSAPANDSCPGAAAILNGNTLIGSLLCASNDGASDCGSAATNPDIWYLFTPLRPGVLDLSLCGSRDNAGVDTGPDTVMSVHTGCPGTIANMISCNDDGFIPGCNTLDSHVRAVLTSTSPVRIRVSHFGSNAFRVGNGVIVLHATYACFADFDHNGRVEPADINLFVNTWFASLQAHTLDGDFDGDGAVAPADISLFVALWFATLSAGGCS